MTNTCVGEVRPWPCKGCKGITPHYYYHSGEWVCEVCGSEATTHD